MVVVRESPAVKISPDKNATQWPPKSPFQALLSSPSGRRKWQDHKNSRQRSSSPSPRKSGSSVGVEELSEASGDDELDEDEETLQLQLKAIQAKLKLKKLQQKAKKDGDGSSERENSQRLPPSPIKSALKSRPPERSDYTQVPVSPSRDRRLEPMEPVSPARRRLGLTSEPRAHDVSLKRARDGTQLKRADSARQRAVPEETPKLSFSQRLNQSRTEAQEREAKQERLDRTRSTGFGSSLAPSAEINGFPSGVAEFRTPRSTHDAKRPSSAHQMKTTTGLDHDAGVERSKSTRASRTERRDIPRVNALFAKDNSAALNDQHDAAPGYDPFSSTHLTKRHISHPDLTRNMDGKEIYPIPRLLKEVKAPDYDTPDCDSDYVVFGVLASKSNPFDQKSNHRTTDSNKPQEDADAPRNKFMVLHLCDGVKWELDLFLFGSAFEQYWKLTPGTLLAILNPGIMPPKGNKDTGAFCLKLGSSEDCSSVKKDGSLCGEWVDKRKTEICEFHLNLAIERNRRTRMEVNSMGRMGVKGNGGDNGIKSRSREKGGYDSSIKKEKPSNVSVHHEYGRLYSMPAGHRKGAAAMLDADDPDALHGMSREEASRKRIADAQRERDLAKKLGQIGSGPGAEYLRLREKTTMTTTITTTSNLGVGGEKTPYFEKPSAESLGLMGNKAEAQHLSPAKDRKRHFGMGAISSNGTEALGWGKSRMPGALKPKPPRISSPEKGQTRLDVAATTALRPGIVRGRSTESDGRLSPKKKARFEISGKGIREPGRESLGLPNAQLEDDEDDLEIV